MIAGDDGHRSSPSRGCPVLASPTQMRPGEPGHAHGDSTCLSRTLQPMAVGLAVILSPMASRRAAVIADSDVSCSFCLFSRNCLVGSVTQL